MRTATINRTTSETDISATLSLSGGRILIDTGIGFFDHMLTALARHAGFGLELTAKGDLRVDCHHTVEDTGIVLGRALSKALGNRAGIARFGTAFVPMDEALCMTVLDLSNRPYLVFDAQFSNQSVGGFDCCMAVEFMRALAVNGGVTLHQKCIYGCNDHHILEALFKSLGQALKAAVTENGGEILSTKGVL